MSAPEAPRSPPFAWSFHGLRSSRRVSCRAGVAGDWGELQDLIIRLREAERRLATMTQPLQGDPGFAALRFILRDTSEILQQSAAQARYAYDVDETLINIKRTLDNL